MAATSGSEPSGTGRADRRRAVRSTRGMVRSARGAAGSMGGVVITGSPRVVAGAATSGSAGVSGGTAGMGAEPVRGSLSMRSSLDGAPLGPTAQTSFANSMAAATASVPELLSRKVPLLATARITPTAIQKRTSDEGPRPATARENARVDDCAPTARPGGGCLFASPTRATASSARATEVVARSVCRAGDLRRVPSSCP